MVEFTGPGLDDFGSGSGFGSGSHDCPAGKHWDDKLQTCVDDLAVGQVPDGHDYQIQKASNTSGLDFTTLYQFDNKADADNTYNALPADGYWQMLVDGVMTKTNLPISDRYDATQDKADEDALKHEYSCEYMLNGEWSWFATAASLEEAKGIVKAAQEGTAYATISYGDYRIRDWHGDIVWSQTIDTPTPDDTSSGGPAAPTGTFDGKGIAMVLISLGLMLFVGWYVITSLSKGKVAVPNAVN